MIKFANEEIRAFVEAISFPDVPTVELYIVPGYDTIEVEEGKMGFALYDPDNKRIIVPEGLTAEDKDRVLSSIAHEYYHHIEALNGLGYREENAEKFAERAMWKWRAWRSRGKPESEERKTMISIQELQDIATSEKEAEDKAAEAKYLKVLATYREQLKEAHPEFIKYIQDRIVTAMKRNQKRAELYSDDVDKIFAAMKAPLPYKVLYYMADETRRAGSALDIAMKEEAENVRKELLEAGVKGFKKGGGYLGDPTIYVLF